MTALARGVSQKHRHHRHDRHAGGEGDSCGSRQEIADERRDIKVGKINVDEEPELANKFSIMSIPTLVVMKNGKIVQQVSGARPKNAILEML